VKKPVYPENLMYPSSGTPARSARGTVGVSAIPVAFAITFCV
jgi:hypothetical protein